MARKHEMLEKTMLWAMCVALCVQRLTVAAGSVFWGLTIVFSICLIYLHRRDIVIEKGFYGYYQALLIFFISLLPSFCMSGDLFASMKEFADMWIYRLLPFCIVTLLARNTKLLTKIILIFISVTGIDCLVALYQAITLHGRRGWGFSGNELQLASLLCIIVPVAVVILLDNTFSREAKLTVKIVLPLLCVGLLAGRSRGAWLTLIIVLPLIMWKYLLKNKTALLVTGLIAVLMCCFFINTPMFMKRVASITNITTDRSNADRIVMWHSAWNMFKDYPFAGVGLGRYDKVYYSGYKLPEMTQKNLKHAHNNIIQMSVETGISGVLGFLYLNMYILLRNFREWKRNNDPYSLIIWGSWLSFNIIGLLDFNLHYSLVIKFWWFLLGTMLVMKKAAAEHSSPE